MNDVAESYVKLVLALGRHDADYVDAYYGPPAWKADVNAEGLDVGAIRDRASALAAQLGSATPASTADELLRLRHEYLRRQLAAIVTRAAMLGGARLTFDEESRALYDAVAPHHGEAHFRSALDRLDHALRSSTGSIAERYERFRARFVVPRERLDAVFETAIRHCRERTLAHLSLPPGESFRVEYVTGKSWSGYNWYQGDYRSLIQVNTSLPVYIDRAVDLACHEGYPGHHAYNVLLEEQLVRGRGWVELSVYPLFSPQSLIAEGSANYGIELTFPGEERVDFERDVLFPLAGLDPASAGEYYDVQELMRALSYAGNEAARGYLDGHLSAAQAVEWLMTYALMTRRHAEQRLRFFDQYRSYVINYNLGQDLVRAYVEREATQSVAERWAVFARLLSSPMLPSDLSQVR